MKTKRFLSTSLALLASVSVGAGHASAADFTIDPDHSNVTFKIKHLMISSVTGRFKDFKGEFSFDPANVASAKADARINVASINTDQQKRDDHLKSPDFFNVAKNPEMTFVTKKVEPVGPKNFKAIGDLTINGVTKPVTLDVAFGGEVKDPWGNDRAAFTATTQLNRKDFGLTWNKALETGGVVVGDDVSVQIEVEGIKKKG